MAKEISRPMTSFEELAKSQFAAETGFDYKSAKAKDELSKFIKSYNVKNDFNELKNKESRIYYVLNKITEFKSVIEFINKFKNDLELVMDSMKVTLNRGKIPGGNYYTIYLDLIELNWESKSPNELIDLIKSKLTDLKSDLESEKLRSGIHAYSDALDLYRNYRFQVGNSAYYPSFTESEWMVTSKDQYRKITLSKKIIGYFEASLTPSKIIERLQKCITRFEI